jgi:hypothetical protein
MDQRSETLKLLEENMIIQIYTKVLNRTPNAQEIRTRVDKQDCIELKSFCTTKGNNY